MIREVIFSPQEITAVKAKVPEVEKLLLGNLSQFPGHPIPLLIAGFGYDGIWLEHNQDNFFLADYAPENAWAGQQVFMAAQRQDGALPALIWLASGEAIYRQLQTVWPFARCAFEVAKKCHRPESDLLAIYQTGKAYDDFLGRFRDHAGVGLVDIFKEYDTGMDNSSRREGMLEGNGELDVAILPDGYPELPVQAPDLSSSRAEGRRALAEIADVLGFHAEAALWRSLAAQTDEAIWKYLYDPEADFFFDRGTQGFRRYRTSHITRLFLNHFFTQSEFAHFYKKYFENDREFLTPWPFPSVSVSDPVFSHGKRNDWGGNTQALTSLRALFWLKHYGREDERIRLLRCWIRAFLDNNFAFTQELDPFSGEALAPGGIYTPALLLFLEGAKIIR